MNLDRTVPPELTILKTDMATAPRRFEVDSTVPGQSVAGKVDSTISPRPFEGDSTIGAKRDLAADQWSIKEDRMLFQ
jgi:hypothetical protein